MCPEEVLVGKIKLMNHYELMSMRISLMEALQASEFQINLDNLGSSSSQVIENIL